MARKGASFENRMRKEVSEVAERLRLDEDIAFAAWYSIITFDLDDEDAVEAVSYGGGNDRGIDILHVSDEFELVVIGQARYYKSSTKSPKGSDLTYLFNTLDEL